MPGTILVKKTMHQNLFKTRTFGLLAALAALLLLTAVAGAEERLSYTLSAGPYTVTRAEDGFDYVSIDGFRLRGSPGAPLLPVCEYRILLPPDADFSTISLTVAAQETETFQGPFEIRPAAPDSAMIEGRVVEDWGGAEAVADGRDMAIYGADTFFPEEIIRRAPNAEMRKYRFLRLAFHPVRYNPVTREFRYTTEAVIRIGFERRTDGASAVNLRDTVLDKEASGLFYNYEDAQPWYEPSSGGDSPSDMASYDLVIITTNAIESNSSKLEAFVAAKREYGTTVWVVTEDDYGTYSGSQRADRIRNWLKAKYSTYNVLYALLIGDPTPGGTGVAAVPMKTCLPKSESSSTPTDMYYSDLSGDWDGDNDGIYGEWADYNTYSDPDLHPELRVGRIPVYGKNYSDLDAILQKIMDYQHTEGDISWRDAVLLPMSYSADDYDGAPLAEQLWDDTLSSNGFSRYRMYQQGSGPCSPNSIYISDQELRGNRVRDHWESNDYGIVCWWAHGSASSASVGYESCWDGTLFNSSQCSDLDNDHPAVVFQNSCTNGYPEYSGNLGYSLLFNGAVGTYSATRVSWFNPGVGYGAFDGSSTNSGIAYEVTRRVAMDYALGTALYYGKNTVIDDIGSRDTRLMNQFDFNLYGDPTVTLADQDTGTICHCLNDALGNYNLTFETEGDALWFCQQTSSAPLGGNDAAQSGDITNNEASSLYTEVKGPGELHFYWAVSSEENWDYLKFFDNGVQKAAISGEVVWEGKTYNVARGTHTLKWSYTKDSTLFEGMDCGWVDYITYEQTEPDFVVTPWLQLLLLSD